LRERIEAALKAQADADLASRPVRPATPRAYERPAWWLRGHGRGFLAPAAGFAFAALLTSNVVLLAMQPSKDERIANEVLASHVRALFTERPIDVESSDRHTVKPWYAGKLGFSPPVADYAADGFTLVGGRLDSVDGDPVAALVYRHDKHLIDVFVWPAESAASKPPARLALRGHNLLHWSSAGMTFWAVSDLDAAELAALQRLMSRARAM
jgi:anti-sigma factor RsiW